MVADLVRGKSVEDAIVTLTYTTKRATGPLHKLLSSAIANAKNLSMPVDKLVVKELKIDGGPILYRRRPRSRGMANPIRKRTSHINITLAEKAEKTSNK